MNNNNNNNDGWDHDRESMIHSLATRQADKDRYAHLIAKRDRDAAAAENQETP
jgi:hypothetical protein